MAFRTFYLAAFLFIALSAYLGSCEGSEDNSDDEALVELERQGKLQGLTFTSRRGRKYFGFLGVPYGKVPERFAVSEPADAWEGIIKAQTKPQACFQFLVFIQAMYGIENCLNLNVFTPKLDTKAKLPVMVWFTPGGFQIGDGSWFDAKYLMDEDVVFVTLNFRLGAMGFLNTGDGEVSGNMGLKDQVLALKWIQENIEKFGGDPNLVTIFGLSAGGASVNHLLLSPMSTGLFHRAISQSGSSLNPWAFIETNVKDQFRQLAENADCMRDNSKATVQCLREKTPEELMNAQLKFSKYDFEFDIISMKFRPSIEVPEAKGPKFFTDSPINIINKGEIASKVPWMSGLTENEGSFYVAPIFAKPESVSKLNKDWDKMAPNVFLYDEVTPSAKVDSVTKKIRDFYFGKKDISEETKRNLQNIFSDRLFANGIVKGIKLQAVHQEVYPYYLDYQGKYSGIQFDFQGVKERDGVAHADDLLYLFNATLGAPESELGTMDGEFSEQFVKLWVSFAKNGKPTATWAPLKEWKPLKIENPKKPQETKLKFYELDLKSGLIDDPFSERRAFWDSLSLKEQEKKDLVDVKEEL